MRELEIVSDRSDSTRLILRHVGKGDYPDDQQEMFELRVDDSIRGLLSPAEPVDQAPESPAVAEQPAAPSDSDADEPAPAAARQQPDPRLSKPLPMTPRDIQDAIRHGATVEQIAAKCDLPESRIAPFAYPVLQERARIVEVAKNSRPVRQDGPCPLTLAELTATALTAQGDDVSAAAWDAWRDHSNQWVITVDYGPDHSQTATWTLVKAGGSHTAVPSDSTAQAITDPQQSTPPAEAEPEELHEQRRHDDEAYGQDVLIPDLEAPAGSRRRRRKAETPHWEDILLSVRSSTKRPRS